MAELADIQTVFEGYPMHTNRILSAIATTAIVVLPLFQAGCASSDQKLANKGFDAIEKGQLVDAEKALGQALDENPDNPYALLNLGTVYQRTGRFDLAREMFEKVIALDPKGVPSRRSKFIEETKTLREIAEDNLKILPAKQ
jgi:Flp pilus assembly protein TadD